MVRFLAKPELSFESLKKHNQHETEYWSARDLQPCLRYSHWRDFKNAIKRAIKSCEQSGNDPKNHFADARKTVGIGSQTDRKLEDYHLSRFTCTSLLKMAIPTSKKLLMPKSTLPSSLVDKKMNSLNCVVFFERKNIRLLFRPKIGFNIRLCFSLVGNHYDLQNRIVRNVFFVHHQSVVPTMPHAFLLLP